MRHKHGYFTEGHPLTRTYRAWRDMHRRCSDPKHKAYARYGGRGITVCEEWSDFLVYLADMGPMPQGRSLDRRDNDKGYFSNNCRWATYTTQNQNRGTFNRRIRFRGETLCASEWARKAGISRALLHWRLKRGWSLRAALGAV